MMKKERAKVIIESKLKMKKKKAKKFFSVRVKTIEILFSFVYFFPKLKYSFFVL